MNWISPQVVIKYLVTQSTNNRNKLCISGDNIRFNIYGGKVFVNGAGLVRGDIKVPRGTVQVHLDIRILFKDILLSINKNKWLHYCST